jgi:hypothetical protein
MKRSLFLLAGVLFGCAAAFAQLAGSPDSVKVPDRVNSQAITEEIHGCPSWLAVAGDDQKLRAKITRRYLEIARSDNETIREGLQQLQLSDNSLVGYMRLKADAKVFALLRVLFDIPRGFLSSEGNYGSWGSPVSKGRVNLLWPYEKDPQGHLVLMGVAGHYYGVPYNALAEFDEFAARFPRRKGGL